MKKFLLLILLQLFTLPTLAAVFVVTTNADSDPGSLRQALTDAAANGNTEKDYINFNLPDLSEAGRTITLQSQLPDVSSNLVIDGTTEPASKFGRSDAKIIIQPSNSNDTYDPFILTNVNGFEMYGLYIRDFVGIVPFQVVAVLFVHSSKNIQIGAPGKGNVFVNNGYNFASIYGHYYGNVIAPVFDGVENLTMYANFFGFEPDGKSFRGRPLGLNPCIDLSGCGGTITIGGDNDDQRNIFGNLPMPIECRGTTPQTSHSTLFNIKNNYFSYNIDGQYAPLVDLNTGNLFTLTITNNGSYATELILPYSLHIINNKIQAPCGFSAGVLSGEIIFQGNQVNNNEIYDKPSYSAGGISFQSLDRVLIGGENPGEGNSLYNAGIVANSPKSILIQHTGVYCINNGFNVVWQPFDQVPKAKLPVINITGVTANSISGMATPLSKIELFWDDDCQRCQPLTYITTINADANGKWQYSGTIQKGVIASATLNGFTSLFTASPVADLTYKSKTVHYSCATDGSITNIMFQNAGGYQWTNANGDIIGTEANMKNLKPGTYKLSVLNGSCGINYTYKIFDATPSVNDAYKHIIEPSCNSKGSITGLNLNNTDVLNEAYANDNYGIYTYKWFDEAKNLKSSSLDLTNADAGAYTLEVTYNNICTTTYGPITLTNTNGPQIDQTNATLTPTNCGESKGSITNITATGTGTLKYSWKNAQNAEVGTAKDLLNQPAGVYTLQVTDDTNCGPVYTSPITIPELNGITIDDSGKDIEPATCQNDDGSITHITVNGATSYKWYNSSNPGVVVSMQPQISNAAPGSYYLIANNATCSKQSATYTITKTAAPDYGGLTKNLRNATCGLNNGRIDVIFQNQLVTRPVSYRWVNHATQQTAGTTTVPILDGLDAGTYDIYATDNSGCERLLISYSIGRDPALTVVSNGNVFDDNCQSATGSIKNIEVTGKSPITYTWTDGNGKTISSMADLTGAAAGTYHLKIADASTCVLNLDYTINEQSAIIASPSVSDLQICSAGDALLSVPNPSNQYTYRLYDSGSSLIPLDEQPGGKFKINVKTNRSYYVSQYLGSCESSRAEVKVSVGITTVNIANTFSPNGDGINDTWKINGIESYPSATVQIFTRSGEKVFESTGYANPFDGTYNGRQLPVSTYYYIINLNSGCNLLSGSLTVVR